MLFTNAGKCSVDAGIHTGYACLHGFSILSLEPEPHLMLPNHDTSSSPDAVQCRSEALFLLYVSHDVSRMMLVTSLYISWGFFVVLSDRNSTLHIFTSKHCIKHKRIIGVMSSALCFKIKLHPLLVFPAELVSGKKSEILGSNPGLIHIKLT